MLIDEARVWTRCLGVERADAPLEARDVFERFSVIDRLERVGAPRERAVMGHQHRRHVFGRQVPLGECLDDDAAGVQLVVLLDFRAAHRTA